jgi:2-methylcitrate dehydratase
MPHLLEKFDRNLSVHFSRQRIDAIKAACSNKSKLETIPVNEFVDLWVPPQGP